MVWRVPSREIGAVPYEQGLELPPEYITRDTGIRMLHCTNDKINVHAAKVCVI